MTSRNTPLRTLHTQCTYTQLQMGQILDVFITLSNMFNVKLYFNFKK